MNTINVIIADDHEIYLDGMRMFLSKQPDIKIIAEASNGKDLVDKVKQYNPDIVLTDIAMPVKNGIEACFEINAFNPAIGVIALSVANDENSIIEILEAGALGYLLKSADKSDIINAIYSVYKGNTYYCKDTSNKLAKIISKSRFNANLNRKQPVFTEKELRIIELICREKTNREIAEDVYLSYRTVETWKLKIQEKINARSIAGIVLYAVKSGIYKN